MHVFIYFFLSFFTFYIFFIFNFLALAKRMLFSSMYPCCHRASCFYQSHCVYMSVFSFCTCNKNKLVYPPGKCTDIIIINFMSRTCALVVPWHVSGFGYATGRSHSPSPSPSPALWVEPLNFVGSPFIL